MLMHIFGDGYYKKEANYSPLASIFIDYKSL